MKPDSLQALIIDRHTGELTGEMEELLQAYLDEHQELEGEVKQTIAAIHLTKSAIEQYPNLICHDSTVERTSLLLSAKWRKEHRGKILMLSRFILSVMVLAMIATAGFLAGRSKQSSEPDVAHLHKSAESPSMQNSPWARYGMQYDANVGRFQVVQLQASQEKEGVLR